MGKVVGKRFQIGFFRSFAGPFCEDCPNRTVRDNGPCLFWKEATRAIGGLLETEDRGGNGEVDEHPGDVHGGGERGGGDDGGVELDGAGGDGKDGAEDRCR